MSAAERPVDPDVDLHVPEQRRELRRAPRETLAAIAAGGVLGALARYGLSSAFPNAPDAFPWAVFWINVSGCLAIGVLMVLITETWRAHRLVRPFLGVGVLGGYTTFSTYAVDVQRAVDDGAPRVGLAYLALTLAAALAAVAVSTRATRAAARAATRIAARRRARKAGEDAG